MKTCQHPKCENEVTGRRSCAKYCSSKCKREAFILNKAKILNGLSTPVSMPTTGLPGDAQFIIKSLERERDRLEEQLSEAVKSKKKYKGKYEAEREAYKDYKAEVKLNDLQRDYEKPEGLSGFMDTHGDKVMALAPEVLPILQGLLSKISNGTDQQMAGLPQAVSNQGKQIIKWISELTEDVSQPVFSLLTAMISQAKGDKAALKGMIIQTQKAISDGTIYAQQA